MQSNPSRFAGKSIVVTGAGAGIGKATAERLAAEGARVIASDIDAGRLDALALGDLGVRVAGDLTDPSVCDAVFAACNGQLDGLANVAGIMDGFLPVSEVDDATWERVFAVNVTAVLRCTRAAIRLMSASAGGAIVNIASEAALRGSAGGTAYTASKHAVVGLSRSAAFFHRGSPIRINVVAPGAVKTSIDGLPRSEAGVGAVMAILQAVAPVLAEPEDIAAAVTWLLSAEARNINGAVLASDGGWCAV